MHCNMLKIEDGFAIVEKLNIQILLKFLKIYIYYALTKHSKLIILQQ